MAPTQELAGTASLDEAARVRLLYRLVPRSTVITLVTAVISAWALWDVASHSLLTGWLAMAISLTLGRYFLYRAFQAISAADFAAQNWRKWENAFAAGALTMGFTWGGLSWIPVSDAEARIIQVFVIGGMALGSAGILGASVRSFACFVIPMLGLQIAAWLFAEHFVFNAAALLMLTFIGALVGSYAEFRRALLNSLASERKVERLNRHQRLIFEAVTAGVGLVRDRHVVDCNPQFAAMLGYTMDEMVGSPTRVYHIDEATWERVGREDVATLREVGQYRREMQFRTKDGAVIICDSTIATLVQGRPEEGIVVIMDDITRKKEQEKALREALLMRTATFANAPVGILSIRERVVEECNDYMVNLLRAPYEEIVGHTTERWFTSHERWQQRGREIYTAFARGESFAYEEELVRGDGSRFWGRLRGGFVDPEQPVGGTVVFILYDITEQKKAEAALQQSREQLVQVIRASQSGIWDYDLVSGDITFSARFFEILGFPAATDPNDVMPITQRLHPEDAAAVLGEFREHLKNRARLDCEFRLKRRNDSYVWVRGFGQATWNTEGRAVRFVGSILDVSERRAREEEIQYLAMHDALTGLPNRRLLEDRLDHSLVAARRNRQQVAVMLLDLDGFKSVNDRHGHEAGDRVLREVARRLRGVVREADTVARTGGDEFVILLESQRQEADVAGLAEKILAGLIEPMELGENRIQIGVSIGIALYPRDSDHPAQLMRMADTAMYAVKEAGRNAYRFHIAESGTGS